MNCVNMNSLFYIKKITLQKLGYVGKFRTFYVSITEICLAAKSLLYNLHIHIGNCKILVASLFFLSSP